MYIKIVGALLIIGCCGAYGVLLASAHRKEVQLLQQLMRMLDIMQSELEYRLTQIPQLCRISAEDAPEPLRKVFLSVADKLDHQETVDAGEAMSLALQEQKRLPPVTASQLRLLGQSLGRFDLHGQLQGFVQCKQACTRQLNELEHNQQQRLRSYQTLGFCAGAALAILLF